MAIQQWSPTEVRPSYPVRLPTASLPSLPATTAEARETAQVAIKFGLASIIFGLVLLALLPKP
jgi:hypothetical protein